MSAHGGESRTGNFKGSVTLHNGMNEMRGIPRFGAGDYSNVDDGMSGIDYHDALGRDYEPGDEDR